MKTIQRFVLVVDDDSEVCRLIADALRAFGHEPLVAHNSAQAFALADIHQIDLLLTEFTLPEMTGIELASQLLRKHPAMKALYMSGFSYGLAATDLDFLAKPFTLKTLREKIREALEPDYAAGFTSAGSNGMPKYSNASARLFTSLSGAEG